MSLKLLSLNIEGDKHFDRFIPFIVEQKPSIVCLQEVFAQDIPFLEKQLNMKSLYAPMVCYLKKNMYDISPRGAWGIATFTNLPVEQHAIRYYKGLKTEIPVFQDGQPNSANRVLIMTQVKKDEQLFRVVTTHFTWTAHGLESDEQRQNFQVFKEVIQEYPDLLLCGDFNVVRGRGGIFDELSYLYKDNIPQNVTSTLDHNLHYAGKLDVVVDGLFSSSHYQVLNVQVVEGLSDHRAIVASITLK